jgi:hypothetical protein
MKATLEFNLPEEHDQFRAASNASTLCCAINHFDEQLRKQLKYDESLSETDAAVLQGVRDELWKLLEQYEVSSLVCP